MSAQVDADPRFAPSHSSNAAVSMVPLPQGFAGAAGQALLLYLHRVAAGLVDGLQVSGPLPMGGVN